eukprot:Lithocolla_globosa_v1_NODE_11346_length_516_cov_3.260304.p2 type:complete len:138 gc:universal NODE_11346_length_516_cov_3.260304:84-497(+)
MGSVEVTCKTKESDLSASVCKNWTGMTRRTIPQPMRRLSGSTKINRKSSKTRKRDMRNPSSSQTVSSIRSLLVRSRMSFMRMGTTGDMSGNMTSSFCRVKLPLVVLMRRKSKTAFRVFSFSPQGNRRDKAIPLIGVV